MMSLFSIPNMVGAHLGAWRHPDAFSQPVMNLQQTIETALLAEQGKFDGLFLTDGNAVRDIDKPALFAANSPVARPGVFDPVVLLTTLAAKTSRIGVVSTATTSFDQPYFITRRFASLDHASGGRAEWNMVTNSYAGDALNFNRADPLSREQRYDRGNAATLPPSGRGYRSASTEQGASGQGAPSPRISANALAAAVFMKPWSEE